MYIHISNTQTQKYFTEILYLYLTSSWRKDGGNINAKIPNLSKNSFPLFYSLSFFLPIPATVSSHLFITNSSSSLLHCSVLQSYIGLYLSLIHI